MSAAKDMRKLMDELAAEMGEETSKFTPDGKQKLTETGKSATTGCDCGSDCKCGGSCDGKCGDEGCPCECGERTGVGINECGSSINESVQLTENSVYEESKFIAIMTWFMAESGMPGKHNAADMLKEKYPEVTPWEWTSGFKVYLNAQKINEHGDIDSITEKETEKYAKRKPYKDAPGATNEPMSPADIDLTDPAPEKVSQTAARAALHGKDTTHGDVHRSGDQPTGWVTPSIAGFDGTMPNPKLGGVYSPAKAWLALMKQPDTVTLYKHGKGHWDITLGGNMIEKGSPNAWAYIQTTRPTGPIIVVDMENKFVKRIALDSQSMQQAIDGGSFDIATDKGDDNWNTQYGFRESIDNLEEQFKDILKK